MLRLHPHARSEFFCECFDVRKTERAGDLIDAASRLQQRRRAFAHRALGEPRRRCQLRVIAAKSVELRGGQTRMRRQRANREKRNNPFIDVAPQTVEARHIVGSALGENIGSTRHG